MKPIHLLIIISALTCKQVIAQDWQDSLCEAIAENDSKEYLLELENEVLREANAIFDMVEETSDRQLTVNKMKAGFLRTIGECYYLGIQVKKDVSKGLGFLKEAKQLGDKAAAHTLASDQLFYSENEKEQKKGLAYLEEEYKYGSAFSAGKLGWAYKRGLGVEADLEKAKEFYFYAAKAGMTYWQFLLAHAYERGYLGFEKDQEQYKYWLNYEPKVHIAFYECWITDYYHKGIYPRILEEFQRFRDACYKLRGES